MTTKLGRIITNTRPGGLNIYLDGEQILDSYGNVAKTPTVIVNVSTGIHNVTFSKPGYDTTTVMVEVEEDSDCYARAILATKSIGYPMMLGNKNALGTVHFDSEPRGAEIIVDGQVLINPGTEESIKTPATVELLEGRRDFILRLEGSEDASGYVDVLAGTTVNIFRNINPGTPGGGEKPQPQIFLTAPNTGVLKVYSFPDGADTYVNGRYVGKAPLTVIDVPAGVATVTWKMPGMMDEEKIVDIVEGAWSETYTTLRPVLPKLSLSSYYQNMDNQDMNYQNMNNQDVDYQNMDNQDVDYQNMDNQDVDYQNMDNQDVDYQNMDTAQYPGSVGDVTVTSYPEGATICIDGSVLTDELGTPIITPATITLLEGYYTIAVESDGYYTGYERIYIYPGAELITSTTLAEKMYMSTIEEFNHERTATNLINIVSMQENVLGNAVITTYPAGAKIYIDGNLAVDAGTMEPITTPVDISLYMGYHDLRFTLEGFYDEFWGIYTNPGDTQYVHRYFNIARSC